MSSFIKKIKEVIKGGRVVELASKTQADVDAQDKVKPSSFENLVKDVCDDLLENPDRWLSQVKLSDSSAWVDAKNNWEPDELVGLALYCVQQSRDRYTRKSTRQHGEYAVLETMASQLLRRKIAYSTSALSELFGLSIKTKRFHVGFGNPIAAITGAAERTLNGTAAEGELKIAIQECLKKFSAKEGNYGLSQEEQKVKMRLEHLLEPKDPNVLEPLPNGEWLASCEAVLLTKTDKQRAAWNLVFSHALTCAGKSKPTKKWLKDAEAFIKVVTRPHFAQQTAEWLNALRPEPEWIRYDQETGNHVTNHDASLDIAKGLMWMVAVLRDESLTLALGRATETCFKKVPGYGARSKKLGNAGIVSMSLMDGDPMAVAELVRLKTQVKYPAVKKDIQKKLQSIADKHGVEVSDLEESSIPDFDLSVDGLIVRELGDFTATITLDEDGVKLTWTGADGKPRKTVPAAVTRDHYDALKQLKQHVKDITDARKTQISRLEASWLEGRTWLVEEWRKRFLNHPLRYQIIKGLIWRIERDGSFENVMLDGGVMRTLGGEDIALTNKDSVTLWHPLNSDPDVVLAWRRRIVDNAVTQPIKQAHREIYVLTDAERTTEVYSNRFAAHILRQHQFRALCHARGWTFDLMGMWDSWNVPTRAVPSRGLSVEYHVEIVDNDEHTDAYIPLHLATDQVRFINASGERMRLEAVEPVVFSELLRDVDLFVAITSVANDPEWTDGGPDGRHGGYWTTFAFGDLSQTAHTRRELLLDLVPKLAIADKLNVTEKYLEVKGKLHDYRIHLGSSNIQIMPTKQYLCIVRGRSKEGETKVKLPFAGDNMLSIILSKAFMLVADDKITDKTILTQLRRV